jgi:hypothetical protein
LHGSAWTTLLAGTLRPTRAMVHTVFSVDGSLYHRWQADLLAFSHRRVAQAGPLTRLWSASERPVPFAGRTFRAESFSPHPISGDEYPPYNKPRALQAWLQEAPPAEDALLLLDPDCVFISPLAASVPRGMPIAQPMDYLDPARDATLTRRHCRKPELAQGVGIPILIHREDMVELAPLWLKRTEEIRDDRKSRELAGWVAEMWGYIFAAADLGLLHTTRQIAHFQMESRADLPLIHYCNPASDPSGRWAWDKRGYIPWECVPEPPATIPLSTRVLIKLVNEWAARKGYQLLPGAVPYRSRRQR